MSIDEYETPNIYNFIISYLAREECVHEIDIVNIDMSSLVYSLPSYNILNSNIENKDILDQVIYETLVEHIVEKDLSNTSIKMLYTKVVDILLTYDENETSIGYNDFSNYYINLYNTITRNIDNYTYSYFKLNKLPIFDNIVDLDRFYIISDVSINTEYSHFMLRVNIALFRRNKDEDSRKRDRPIYFKT